MIEEVSNEEIVKLRQEFAKETRKRIVQGVFAGVFALVALAISGWWFVLSPKIDEFIAARSGLPRGAVVAFQSSETMPCPTDSWVLFHEMKGRMIVGAGQNTDIDANLTTRILGRPGGAENIVLRLAEIPDYQHELSDTGLQHMTLNHVPIGSEDVNELFLVQRVNSALEINSSAGETLAHENMPPFMPLYYCIKM